VDNKKVKIREYEAYPKKRKDLIGFGKKMVLEKLFIFDNLILTIDILSLVGDKYIVGKHLNGTRKAVVDRHDVDAVPDLIFGRHSIAQ